MFPSLSSLAVIIFSTSLSGNDSSFFSSHCQMCHTRCVSSSLIFLANILCVHVRKSDEMYASPTWCTHAKKKNETEVTVHTSLAFDFAQRSLHRMGPPMCSPFIVAKRDHLVSSLFFVKVMHY